MQSRSGEQSSKNKRKLERQVRHGTTTSRNREKAMEGARNPGFSKFGDCLVSINSKTDKALTSNLRKINSEIRRMEMQINQKIKYFVKNSAVLNHDPLILVERPPSPEVIKRAFTMSNYEDDDFPLDADKPGYMQQIRSKARTPSTLTTIDAFTVKSRKKKNVWDGAVEDITPPQFQSTVRPFAKLTKREKTELQKGYEFHKPKLDGKPDNEIQDKPDSRMKTKAVQLENDDIDDITPFITQMATVRKKKTVSRKEKTLASISVDRISPILAISAANSPVVPHLETDKSVRFSSPIVLSEPGSKQTKRKLKTKATRVTY